MRYACLLSFVGFGLFFGTIALFVLPSLLLYYLIKPFHSRPEVIFQHLASWIYRFFFWSMPKFRLHLPDLPELPSSAIYISTHQSHIDYPVLGCLIPDYLILTRINFSAIPFIALVGKLLGARFLERHDAAALYKSYLELETMLKIGGNVIFFAEGTRHTGAKLNPFKQGAFRLAIKTQRPIVPVVIEGTQALLPKSQFCLATVESVDIRVSILEPIRPEMFTSAKSMAHHAQELMQKEKERLCAI